MGGMPAVQRPGQVPVSGGYPQNTYAAGAGYRAPGPAPSGGYSAPRPATQGGGAGSDRTTLLIAIGVVAVALFIILAALISRRNDEGAQSYTAQVKSDFVDKCTTRASEAVCQCTIDDVVANVPFDDFKAYSDELGDDASAPNPDWLVDALSRCESEAPSVSS